jgi:hypothetical protein
MKRKPRSKTVAARSKSRSNVNKLVRNLASSGASEDEIGAHLGMGRSRVRARHILDVKAGREIRRKQQTTASDMSREEMHACDAILGAFSSSKWNGPEGNLLWRGVGGGPALTPADAYAGWLARGAKFVVTGLDHNFSLERLRQFAEVKAAAEKLRV